MPSPNHRAQPGTLNPMPNTPHGFRGASIYLSTESPPLVQVDAAFKPFTKADGNNPPPGRRKKKNPKPKPFSSAEQAARAWELLYEDASDELVLAMTAIHSQVVGITTG